VVVESVDFPSSGIVLGRKELPLKTIDLIAQTVALLEKCRKTVDWAAVQMRRRGVQTVVTFTFQSNSDGQVHLMTL